MGAILILNIPPHFAFTAYTEQNQLRFNVFSFSGNFPPHDDFKPGPQILWYSSFQEVKPNSPPLECGLELSDLLLRNTKRAEVTVGNEIGS